MSVGQRFQKFKLVRMLLLMILFVWASAALNADAAYSRIAKRVRLEDGKYYLQKEDGTYRTKVGWASFDGNRYYVKKDMSLATGFKMIDGKLYRFTTQGTLIKKTGWVKTAKNTFYYYKNHSIARGYQKINGKYYLFGKRKGYLQRNKEKVMINGRKHDTDSTGCVVEASDYRARCRQAAKDFISRHSDAKKSKAEKFRQCFYYLLGNMRYTPGYYSVNSDYAKISEKDWQYKLALETFHAYDLRGNCHRFACCVAAIAAELGYQPTIFVATGDHSYVIIDGKYYDNMGALFRSDTPSEQFSCYKLGTM